jgi:hypothetical protein
VPRSGRAFVAAASRGRYSDEHDVVFVMRKPEDRFARVL